MTEIKLEDVIESFRRLNPDNIEPANLAITFVSTYRSIEFIVPPDKKPADIASARAKVLNAAITHYRTYKEKSEAKANEFEDMVQQLNSPAYGLFMSFLHGFYLQAGD